MSFVPLGRSQKGVFQALLLEETAPKPPPLPPPEPLPATALERPAVDEAEISAALVAAEQDREAAQEQLEQARAILIEAQRSRRETLKQASEDIAELVVALTRRMVRDALSLHPEALPSLVRDAIGRLPEHADLEVLVPPGRVELVQVAITGAVRVRADPSLQAGCRVLTTHSSLDVSLHALISGVESAVHDWLAEQA